MADLERDLVALGAVLDVPTDEYLASRVRATLEDAPHARRRRRLAVIVAALLGIGVVTVPVVGDVLRVGDVDVRQEPPPASVPSSLDLGRRTTLAAAGASVDFTIVVPAALGAPDEVWLDEARSGDTVWLAYRPRPGLPEATATGYGALVALLEASINADVLATKFVGPEASVEQVSLGTGPALWIGGVHHIGLLARSGEFVVESLRLADRVLLWERGAVTLRLESALDRDASLRIARSVP